MPLFDFNVDLRRGDLNVWWASLRLVRFICIRVMSADSLAMSLPMNLRWLLIMILFRRLNFVNKRLFVALLLSSRRGLLILEMYKSFSWRHLRSWRIYSLCNSFLLVNHFLRSFIQLPNHSMLLAFLIPMNFIEQRRGVHKLIQINLVPHWLSYFCRITELSTFSTFSSDRSVSSYFLLRRHWLIENIYFLFYLLNTGVKNCHVTIIVIFKIIVLVSWCLIMLLNAHIISFIMERNFIIFVIFRNHHLLQWLFIWPVSFSFFIDYVKFLAWLIMRMGHTPTIPFTLPCSL